MSHKCAVCGKVVERPLPPLALPSYFPFCSPRCKQVDLGRWFVGTYTIARPLDAEDLEELDDAPEETNEAPQTE